MLSSIFVGIYGIIWLGEPFGTKEFKSLGTSLFGCVLIIKPSFLFEENNLEINDIYFLMCLPLVESLN